mmetsp:Transcript_25053/g.70145  ORF Transcript_25053/g.70145 Transcript_25053/m.70145 type:complete len:333 (-) Transcript_25053:2566-3564(-)
MVKSAEAERRARDLDAVGDGHLHRLSAREVTKVHQDRAVVQPVTRADLSKGGAHRAHHQARVGRVRPGKEAYRLHIRAGGLKLHRHGDLELIARRHHTVVVIVVVQRGRRHLANLHAVNVEQVVRAAGDQRPARAQLAGLRHQRPRRRAAAPSGGRRAVRTGEGAGECILVVVGRDEHGLNAGAHRRRVNIAHHQIVTKANGLASRKMSKRNHQGTVVAGVGDALQGRVLRLHLVGSGSTRERVVGRDQHKHIERVLVASVRHREAVAENGARLEHRAVLAGVRATRALEGRAKDRRGQHRHLHAQQSVLQVIRRHQDGEHNEGLLAAKRAV